MGTRSTIAIQNSNGTVTGIYCHWDGKITNNGRILAENYTTEAGVRELIALGNLSSLGETVGSKHDFNNAPSNECNAYGRDRGETGVDAKTFDSHSELVDQIGQEYDYLFVPGQGWSVARGNGHVTLDEALSDALLKETV